MTDGPTDPDDDLKAKMREALERKKRAGRQGDPGDAAQARGQGKTHGPEVAGGAAPRMHRRKAGGGGS